MIKFPDLVRKFSVSSDLSLSPISQIVTKICSQTKNFSSLAVLSGEKVLAQI
jgi:hypothetical protein